MSGHIHGHPASHRRLSLNHAHRSAADNQDPDRLNSWSVLYTCMLVWTGLEEIQLRLVSMCVCMRVYCRIGFLKGKSLSMHNHPSHKINTFQIIHHQLLCFHSCIYPTTAQFPHKIVLSELLLNQVHQTPKTFFL